MNQKRAPLKARLMQTRMTGLIPDCENYKFWGGYTKPFCAKHEHEPPEVGVIPSYCDQYVSTDGKPELSRT